LDELKILSKDEVQSIGKEFDGDSICYSLEFEGRTCEVLEDGSEKPLTGMIYELSSNGNLVFYCTYKDGLKDGDEVEFYESGNLLSFNQMHKGVVHGKSFCWHDNGKKKSDMISKYGYRLSIKEWDENGILVKEDNETSEIGSMMIKKYDEIDEYLRSQATT